MVCTVNQDGACGMTVNMQMIEFDLPQEISDLWFLAIIQ